MDSLNGLGPFNADEILNINTNSNVGDSNFFRAFGDKSAENLKHFEIENEWQNDKDNNIINLNIIIYLRNYTY